MNSAVGGSPGTGTYATTCQFLIDTFDRTTLKVACSFGHFGTVRIF